MRLVLDSHPEIAIGEESGFMRAVQAMRSIPNWRFGEDWYERFGLADEEMNARIREFFSSIFGEFAEKQGKRRWGEKTPFHRWHMEAMAEIFPDAQFVAVVRHPAPVALSLTGWGYEWDQAVDDWRRSYLHITKTGAKLQEERYRLIRYEDLVVEPRATLGELLEFLGEPWSDAVLRHDEVQKGKSASDVTTGGTKVSDPVDAGRVDMWRQRVDHEQLRSIEDSVGALMRRFGYTLESGTPLEALDDQLAHGRARVTNR